MNKKRDEELRALLAEVGLANDSRIGTEWWMQQRDQNRVPVMEVALFLRETWKRIIADEHGAVESLLKGFEERIHDDDGYQADRLKSNQQFAVDIRDALKNPRLGPALLYLVRAAQIEVAFSLVSLMDGGESFDDGHWASWCMVALDGNNDPGETFGDIKELFWHFDPARTFVK